MAEVWSHSGVWSLKSGGWNLEPPRNLKSGVWCHSGAWSLESGVTPEYGG